MAQPDIATRDCSDCQKYQYDDKISDRGVMTPGARAKNRKGEDQLRIAGPPPCQCCPKKSPNEAHQYELSDKNMRTLNVYYQHRGANNLSLRQRADGMLARNLAVVDRLVRAHELETSLSNALATTPIMAIGVR